MKFINARPAYRIASKSKMGLLFLMYFVQKLFLYYTWTLVPILMRTQGQNLGSIGLTALLYSPWALKFLPAPWIDRFHSPGLGRRKTWIIPLVTLFLIMQLMLSAIQPEMDMALFLSAIFTLNILSATMDIAMDAYATDILLPEERPLGNTVQTMGYVSGYMMGAGFFLMIYHQLGWQITLWSMVGLQWALVLPILLHKEIPPVQIDLCRTSEGSKLRIRSFINRPQIRWLIPFILIAILVDQGGSRLHLPMLVDKGYDPASIGRLNLWFGSLASIFGAAAGALLFKRSKVRTIFCIACMGAGCLCIYTAFLSGLPLPSPLQVGVLMGAEKFISGSVTVLLYTLIMESSAGQNSATGNAILNSLLHLFMLAVAPIAGMICDYTGFYLLFMGLGLVNTVLLPVGDTLLRQCLTTSSKG